METKKPGNAKSGICDDSKSQNHTGDDNLRPIENPCAVVQKIAKDPDTNRPTIASLRQLKTEIMISNDDLREVLMMFLTKLSIHDMLYAIITLSDAYEIKKYGYAA